ncbi:MAG: hypothetical protein P1U36_03800 [Legionellaceae bacterium]|nr:hypothetical protein [Legionellaceae bacterium]
MTNHTHDVHDMRSLSAEPLPKHTNKAYEPPALIRLQDSEPEGGSLNVPEASTGLLES